MNQVQCFSGMYVSQFSQLSETQIETAALPFVCFVYCLSTHLVSKCLTSV